MDTVLKYFGRIAGGIATQCQVSQNWASVPNQRQVEDLADLSVLGWTGVVWPCVTQGRFVRKKGGNAFPTEGLEIRFEVSSFLWGGGY